MELGFSEFFPFLLRFMPKRSLGKLGTTGVWANNASCPGFEGQRTMFVRAFRGLI